MPNLQINLKMNLTCSICKEIKLLINRWMDARIDGFKIIKYIELLMSAPHFQTLLNYLIHKIIKQL